MKHTARSIAAILFFVLCGACSSLKANVEDGADLGANRSFYVVHQENDKRSLHESIATKLRETGRTAQAGTLAEMPAGTDIMVTYVDRWMWDITNYLRSLEVMFRDPQTEAVLASGTSKRDSLTRKAPEFVVDEVIGKIFEQVEPVEAASPTP